MRIAARVILTDEQSAQLEAYARGRRIAARLVLRAKIVLLAAEGKQDLEIAAAWESLPEPQPAGVLAFSSLASRGWRRMRPVRAMRRFSPRSEGARSSP